MVSRLNVASTASSSLVFSFDESGVVRPAKSLMRLNSSSTACNTNKWQIRVTQSQLHMTNMRHAISTPATQVNNKHVSRNLNSCDTSKRQTLLTASEQHRDTMRYGEVLVNNKIDLIFCQVASTFCQTSCVRVKCHTRTILRPSTH